MISIFDLVISGLFELKFHIDRRRIRTLEYDCCMTVRNMDYQLGHAPLLESLLGMNVSECIYKDVNIIFIKMYLYMKYLYENVKNKFTKYFLFKL